jgi:hypothetical protein
VGHGTHVTLAEWSVVKNGIDRRRGTFTPWFWSYRWAARIEAAIVACVFAGVLAIMVFLFRMPGPLVVHVQDDLRQPVQGARVRCTSPDGQTSYAGATDVFGEAKWPGLAKGPWKCEVTPPERFHGGEITGFATVAARHPAMWTATVERPGRIVVDVARPPSAPRAPVAVRAVCADGETWEARAGLLDGRAVLYVPHGAICRAGLVRPELPGEGPSTQKALDCAAQPCTGELSAGVGQQVDAKLTPTAQQWMAVRPPLEAEPADGGAR